MSDKINRPKGQKKISHRDEFELCYMRHRYLRRVSYNPSEIEMEPYKAIITNIARNTYNKCRALFNSVGFYLQDLVNIGMIHLVSFLGLFAIEKLPKAKYGEFIRKFKEKHLREPVESEILDKNKANFTIFLKQRMEDLVRICTQKVKNIKGTQAELYNVYYGKTKPQNNLADLSENYELYGYKKIDIATFKTVRKKAGAGNRNIFCFNKIWYIAVPVEQRTLNLEDFSGADLNPSDNVHNLNPEETLSFSEERLYWDKKNENFNRIPKRVRVKMMKEFIENNKDDPSKKQEIEVARKFLRTAEAKIVRA